MLTIADKVIEFQDQSIQPWEITDNPKNGSMEQSISFIVRTGSYAIRAIAPILDPETIACFRINKPFLDAWVVGFSNSKPTPILAHWN